MYTFTIYKSDTYSETSFTLIKKYAQETPEIWGLSRIREKYRLRLYIMRFKDDDNLRIVCIIYSLCRIYYVKIEYVCWYYYTRCIYILVKIYKVWIKRCMTQGKVNPNREKNSICKQICGGIVESDDPWYTVWNLRYVYIILSENIFQIKKLKKDNFRRKKQL